MPYYPKNRIQTNLYTNGGEYNIVDTGENYTGYYYKLYNNTFFTGKTPNDLINQELIPFVETIQDQNQFVIVEPFPDPSVNTYNQITEIPSPKKLPIPYYPTPTEQDYKIGELQRYFSKQINDTKFTEINKSDFNALVSKDSSYLWELFITISIPWDITGNKDQVEQTNKNITLLTEVKNKVFGFSKFIELTGGYLKFYQ
jgi:hypothetical protein